MSNILYQGAAASTSSGALELITNYNYLCRGDLATYAERLPIWDSDTGKIADFTTQFSFIVDTLGLNPYGHGLAFFLAPVGFQIPPNSAGGFLGLFNTTTTYSDSNRIVIVEFDSFSNPEWDPSGVLKTMWALTIIQLLRPYTRWNASYHSGDIADVQIAYNSTTKNLSVFWTYRQTLDPMENTSLFYLIDLMKILPQWVTVGFSAATGMYRERHVIQSWEFNSSLDI